MSEEVTAKTLNARLKRLKRDRWTAFLYCFANLCVCATQLWLYLNIRSVFFILSAAGSGIFSYVQIREIGDLNKKIKSTKLLWVTIQRKNK